VFKTRPANRAARPQGSQASPTITSQAIDVRVSENSTLYLLPDPVTCFRSASYNQIQTCRLSRGASLVLLDWITSGRIALGEEWALSRYYSANHVWVEGKLIAKDVMLLEDPTPLEPSPLAPRTLLDRLSPYSCYATLILYGPSVKSTILALTKMYEGITVFKTASPEPLIWSVSPINGGEGCIVRVAGKETEIVRGWLGDALRDLKDVIGIDIYRKAFP
jgi:urease accessory protein